jgi:hypothetical protein
MGNTLGAERVLGSRHPTRFIVEEAQVAMHEGGQLDLIAVLAFFAGEPDGAPLQAGR